MAYVLNAADRHLPCKFFRSLRSDNDATTTAAVATTHFVGGGVPGGGVPGGGGGGGGGGVPGGSLFARMRSLLALS